MGDWLDFRDHYADRQAGLVTKELVDALDTAESLTKPVKPEPTNKRIMVKKRSLQIGAWEREPFEGYSEKHSNVARHVVGLKYSGEALREAFQNASEKYDLAANTIENLYYTKRRLFELAEQEHVENALRDYHSNLWICRTMLSEAGPRAIDTLLEVMDNRKSSPNVKAKTAIAVLKMLDIDGSSNANPTERAAVESLKLIRDMRKDITKEQESHIVEAEDAEILDEEDERVD
jgi:hypothetical protein